MKPHTIIFSREHWDSQGQIAKSADFSSADLRAATLRVIALLLLSGVLAVFAIMTTRQIPSLMAASAFGKLLAIAGFNLFAGYMLFDALSEARKLCCLCWDCEMVEAEIVQVDGVAAKQAAVFASTPKRSLPLDVGYRFVCPKSGRTMIDSRQVKWQFRPKLPLPKVGDRIVLQYVDPALYIIL